MSNLYLGGGALMEGTSYSFPPAPPDNCFLNASNLGQSSIHRDKQSVPGKELCG